MWETHIPGFCGHEEPGKVMKILEIISRPGKVLEVTEIVWSPGKVRRFSHNDIVPFSLVTSKCTFTLKIRIYSLHLIFNTTCMPNIAEKGHGNSLFGTGKVMEMSWILIAQKVQEPWYPFLGLKLPNLGKFYPR